MNVAVALRWILRESRGAWGRMAYLAACLAVGVAAVVGTAAVAASVEGAFRERSREILGADLTVDARRPLPPELDILCARHPGLERTNVLETPSMAVGGAPGDAARRSALVQVLAITGRYPLRGELTTEPPGGLGAHLAADTVVATREALDALGVRTGDVISLGGARLRVAAAVVRAPPQFGFSALLGPRVYVSGEAFATLGLTGFGSRAKHVAMLTLPQDAPADLAAFEAEVRALPQGEYLDVDTHFEAGPGGGSTQRRVTGFIGLAALLSMLVGGIGVAQTIRVWVADRTRAIAVLRCLGVRPAEILVVSLGHTALLAVAGSAVGATAGCALPWIVGAILPDLVPGGFPPLLALGHAFRGVALGTGVALVFAVVPLLAVWRVSPALALRADAIPLPAPRGAAAGAFALLAAGIFGAALLQSRRFDWSLTFTAGIAALAAALWGASRLAVAIAARLPRTHWHPAVRHGVAALARPGAGTAASIVALGLGTMVVATTHLVQTRLGDALRAQLPADAPSVYLVDVQPSQWPALEAELRATDGAHIDHVPVITARIASIDGIATADLAEGGTGARGVPPRGLTREHRLTSRETLDASNRIIEGSLWSDPARAEVSLEERFARDLGARLGTVLVFDVQGVPVEVVVTSIRQVTWQSFSINFFVVVEPGVLDRAPGLVLASARVPAEREAALQLRIAGGWPNVSVIRLAPILGEVAALLDRVTGGIAALGSFSVAAGLLVLAGAASAAALRRRREIALLKTLGVTRRGVAALLAVEHAIVGAVAGAVGATGASVLAWSFLRFVADIPATFPVLAVPIAALACGAAAAVCGLVASVPALRARPIEALR